MIKELKYSSRDEWLEMRKKYIGGSDAGAVMGLNAWTSPFALWAEKTGRVPGFEGNISTRVGSRLEDLVAELFTEETGKKVRRKNRILVNDQYPWACANLDRVVVGEKALLEIKTTASLPVMKRVRGGDYPEQWYCQMMHYLAVTGLERAYLAALIGNRELQVFVLERDEDEIAALMTAEQIFWDCVINDIPPAPDGSASTEETLGAMFPASSDDTISLYDAEHLLKQRAMLMQSKKQVETSLREIDNQIKSKMEDAGRAVCGKWTVTWKDQERSAFDRKLFEQAHPEIPLDPYYKLSVSRVFRVTEKKQKEAS